MKNGAIQKLRVKMAILAVPVLVTGAVLGIANPASASVRGVDLQAAGCNIQAPGTSVVLRSNNVYGWKCFTGLYDLGLSVDQACKWTYGSGSSAYYLSYSNPYSWRCT
jgi:hypothetical protein